MTAVLRRGKSLKPLSITPLQSSSKPRNGRLDPPPRGPAHRSRLHKHERETAP